VDAAAYGGSQTQSFSYYNNALNQLWTAQATGGSYGTYSPRGYQYNNAGNLTSFEGNAYAYHDAGHKHGVTHIGGVQKYWYDANGNVTRRIAPWGTDITLAYDAENRLTQVSGGVTASYTYDGDGVRVKAVVNGTTSVYVGNYYEITGGVVKKYYYAGSVRVAENNGGTLHFLLTDHLGSTATTTDANGNRVTELRYLPFGDTRYNPGGQITTYRFTGQRWDSGTGLYWYNSRWYDPLIGRFIQADTLVPQPGNPQSLNRYSYVRNNPLRFVDPSGMAECAAGDQQCWINEWNWKNRWYNAHGYGFENGHWSKPIDPVMADADIARDVLTEANIHLAGSWQPDYIQQMARGVARFGQKLATSGGLARLRDLLGSPVRVRSWHCGAGACAPPANVWFSWEVWFPSIFALADVAGMFVHELAHVIDWNAHYSFSGRWGYAPLTDYAANNNQLYPQSWDRWAEAVAVWVMGDFDATGAFVTSHKSKEVTNHALMPGTNLTVQMNRLNELLNGWR
jgi:RHS repeat-associated protein